MIDKRVADPDAAVAGTPDGAVVMIGGFGGVGQPVALIDALREQGARDLTVIANNAGIGRAGLARLIEAGRVRKIVCSFPRAGGSVVFEEMFAAGRIELELVPQGTLAERIRAAGAGIPAFYTPTGADTLLAAGKEVRAFRGRRMVLEHALGADLALVEAWEADRWGNLRYRGSGRNFNAVMATAARCTVAQVSAMRSDGALDPEAVVTPGIHVDRVVHVPHGGPPSTDANDATATSGGASAPVASASHRAIAARLARDLVDGWAVNLGIGLPTLVADALASLPDREVVLHSENGVIGMGPRPPAGAIDPWLIDAGKRPVTLLPGGAFVHQADGFAAARSGRLDLAVLGAYEVAANGDLANWATGAGDRAPGVGGAMDLAAGARRIWVMTEHVTRDGRPKLVGRCRAPLTAAGVVSRIYTDWATIAVVPRGFVLLDRAPHVDLPTLRARTGAPLHLPEGGEDLHTVS